MLSIGGGRWGWGREGIGTGRRGIPGDGRAFKLAVFFGGGRD